MHSEKFKKNRFDSVEFAPPKNLATQQRVLIEQRKQATKEYYRTGNSQSLIDPGFGRTTRSETHDTSAFCFANSLF